MAAEGTSSRAAAEVLEEPGRVEPPANRWRPKSRAYLTQEFWEDAGFPAPASRFWECSSPVADSNSAGKSLSSLCRTPSSVGDVSLEGRSTGKEPRRSTSPQSIGLRKMKVRLGWRGPLPRPRLTPPPCLGEFFPEKLVAAMEESSDRRSAQGGGEQSSAVVVGAVFLDHGAVHAIQTMGAGR